MNIWDSPIWNALEGEDRWVSWEEISRIFSGDMREGRRHLSRFVDEGFSLIEHPTDGCRIESRPDRLFPPWVLQGLQTETFGKNLRYAHTVSSTQDEAVQWARAGAPEGAVVLCEFQLQGRGRRGRRWISPPGTNILMSVLVRDLGSPEASFVWTQAASLSVSEAVEREIQDRVWIKWPNDLYLRGRKLCGILAERETAPGKGPFMVIGIGLNVAAAYDDASSISLGETLQHTPRRADLVRNILTAMEGWSKRIKAGGPAAVWKPWISRSLLLGRRILVQEEDRTYQGTVEGFLPDGRLQLIRETGDRVLLSAGDVSILPVGETEGP